ncbi:DUF262 domain-containing protein [Methanobacterium formicicum]|uniref:GmrSD restriction endonucleases N-terminal domain-containing protein n=1 Tax=Methanobacterium formicicum (strain DSM 3637 / PP1) TaxID=1204725 RepID=K2RW06_METFP|nr:DUF262 domain-containing protein [Methanobacterium formicicum]EKF86935.1 hypothetical protein A994_01575 [Methanobacterium formicicum DSM 3637]
MVKDPSPIKSVGDLLKGVENGEYVIPNFQRKYEWNPGMVSDLLISIFQDYYTGLLLFWEFPEQLAIGEWDPLWGADQPENPYFAILDGQQRLSSLYYALYAPNKKFPYRNTYYMFFLDLNEYIDDNYEDAIFYKFSKSYMAIEDVKNRKNDWINENIFPLRLLHDKDFMSNDFDDWAKGYAETFVKMTPENLDDFIKLYDNIRNINRIMDYSFITHTLGKDRDLSDICGIFAKINQKGMRLSTFDLMNAFLFPQGIRLRKLWEKQGKNELKKVDRSMNEYILKLMSLYKQDYCSSKYVFYLIPQMKIKKRDEIGKITLVEDSKEFKNLWDNAYHYAIKAVERIMNIGKNDFGAIKYDFIQNKTMIPVMGAIMWKYEKDYSNIDRQLFDDLLSKWYWYATISGDYSGSSDSIMSEDYRDFKKWFIIQDESVIRRLNRVNNDDIQKLDLASINKGSSLYNTVLCLLALNKAPDFYTGRPLDSGTFKGIKIHDHHIFPKNVKNLPKATSTYFEVTNDSIVNRTLLLDETNEKIKNKIPSTYLKSVEMNDEELNELMQRHFISEKALEYLKDDNYDSFIVERERTIKNKLIDLLTISELIKDPNTGLDRFTSFKTKNRPWEKHELLSYLDNTTTFQKLFLASITQTEENPAPIQSVIIMMNKISKCKFENVTKEIDGLTIAGVKSGLTARRKGLGKEDIIEAKDIKGIIYYSIREKYIDIIREWITNEDLMI